MRNGGKIKREGERGREEGRQEGERERDKEGREGIGAVTPIRKTSKGAQQKYDRSVLALGRKVVIEKVPSCGTTCYLRREKVLHIADGE